MGDASVVLRVQTKKDIGKLEKFVSLGNMISHFCFSPNLCFYPLIHTSRLLSALLEMFFFLTHLWNHAQNDIPNQHPFTESYVLHHAHFQQ